MTELEKRLAALEEQFEAKIAKLELDLAKERAVTQIQNCMGRYAYMHTGGLHTECMECFAVGDPDLSIEIGPMGKFVGPDAAYRVYHLGHNAGEGNRLGFLAEHTLTTPVIEVADDLKTAKAIWISPGHETAVDPVNGPEPQWMWGRYAMDFKNVDGEWKIWHFQMFGTFRCDFDTPWTQTEPCDRRLKLFESRDAQGEAEELGDMVGAMGRPDFPTSFMEEYAPDRAMKMWPAPPEPYATFEGTRSMVGAPENYVYPG